MDNEPVSELRYASLFPKDEKRLAYVNFYRHIGLLYCHVLTFKDKSLAVSPVAVLFLMCVCVCVIGLPFFSRVNRQASCRQRHASTICAAAPECVLMAGC